VSQGLTFDIHPAAFWNLSSKLFSGILKIIEGVKERMKQELNVIIEKDPETGWLVGEVAELPGCYTQAPNMMELEKNIRDAITAYLQTLEEEAPRSQFVGTLRIEVNS